VWFLLYIGSPCQDGERTDGEEEGGKEKGDMGGNMKQKKTVS
jgi:hypothetical protein